MLADRLDRPLSRYGPGRSIGGSCEMLPTVECLQHAHRFVACLPKDALRAVEIGIDNDGDIAFDWDFGVRRVFSVRVSPTGVLAWAGLLGEEKFHGSDLLGETLPEAVSQGLERILKVVK